MHQDYSRENFRLSFTIGTSISTINKINERLAVAFTRAFGTMWLCYAFMIYGLLPILSIFRGHENTFLYWSNWVQLWSLPLILVGTNILGRDADERSRLDHDKLARAYEEQKETYARVLAMLVKQEQMMANLEKQDEVLRGQDEVLAEQTELLREQSTVTSTATTKS